MDREQIQLQLIQWMKDFVEQPNPKLGNWAPCPYARAARINNKIVIKFAEVGDFIQTIQDSYQDLETMDLVIICFNQQDIDPVTLQEWVTATNQSMLMPNNYVILEDHPDSPEYINGVSMNFGQCGLLMLQRLDKLNTAADQLQEKGYYQHWDQRSIDNVVTWRYNK